MNDSTAKHVVSFIVPVLNGANYMKRCLDHILADKYPQDEVIVVDNGSSDNTLEIVRAYPDIKILQYPRVTIAALRNRGAETAKGDLLAFIDSDCLVCTGWRSAVDDVMRDESYKATGSIYDIPDESTWVERAWLSERENNVMPISYLASGNLIVRKNIYQELGGFNESLVTDEDYDLGARMTAKGYTILHEPRIRVIHLGNPKTLKQHFLRKLWHSTSMIDTARRNGLDKPLLMTFAFVFFCLLFLVLLPVSIHNGLLLGLTFMGLWIVPVATSFYRIIIYKNYRYFFELIILYLVFYLARVTALAKIILGIK